MNIAAVAVQQPLIQENRGQQPLRENPAFSTIAKPRQDIRFGSKTVGIILLVLIAILALTNRQSNRPKP